MFGMRAVMLFLSQFGIKSSTAVAIWKRWGTMAQKIIEENPYLLCSEEIGLSFDDCEAIARRLGVPPDSSYRIEAALQFILRHNLLNGHTCLPLDKLLPTAQKLLSQSEIMVEKELEALLRRLAGEEHVELRRAQGVLEGDFPKESKGRRLIRARMEGERVTLTGDNHSSGSLATMIGCNCLIDIPAGTGPLHGGDRVEVILL